MSLKLVASYLTPYRMISCLLLPVRTPGATLRKPHDTPQAMADAAVRVPSRLPTLPETQWLGLSVAADFLGISSSSLRRRLCHPHWVEGRHYRWINKGKRRTLQVNLVEANRLINLKGW